MKHRNEKAGPRQSGQIINPPPLEGGCNVILQDNRLERTDG
jgi:hypothetical protein